MSHIALHCVNYEPLFGTGGLVGAGGAGAGSDFPPSDSESTSLKVRLSWTLPLSLQAPTPPAVSDSSPELAATTGRGCRAGRML